MTQPKIPARLPVGSAEFYAEMLRDSPRNPDNFYAYAMGLVAHIVDDADLQILVRTQRIRNVVAAVELIRDESTPGMDYQRDTDDGSAPGPRPAPHFEDGRNPGVEVADEPEAEAPRELLGIVPTADGGVVFAMSGPPPVVHYLDCDADGGPGDSAACGVRVGDINSYTTSLDRVTCGMCRAVEPVSEAR